MDTEKEDSGDEYFKIEHILKDRVNSEGRKEYLVKWIGKEERYNKWMGWNDIEEKGVVVKYENERNNMAESKRLKKNTKKRKSVEKSTYSWEVSIKEVVHVFKDDNGFLMGEYVLLDGRKGVCSTEELKKQCPLKLLNFYEKHLVFFCEENKN